MPLLPLKSLEEKARQLGMTPEVFRQWLLRSGHTNEDIERIFAPDSLRSDVQRLSVGPLIPRAASFLGWSATKLERLVKVNVINSDDLDCRARLSGGLFGLFLRPSYELRVYAGLLFFLNKVTRALLPVFDPRCEPIPEAVNEASTLLRALYSPSQLQNAWSVHPHPVNRMQEESMATLLGWMRDAAVAHEFGHIICGAGQNHLVVRKLIDGAETTRHEWLQTHSGNASHLRPTQNWDEELVADRIGFQLLLGPHLPARGFELIAAPHGMVFLLLIIDMIERIRRLEEPATHPHASLRLLVLQLGFKAEFPSVTGPFVDGARIMCERIALMAGAAQRSSQLG